MATLTKNINYLQPTGFRLTIDRENYPNLQFFCQSVDHPNMEVSFTNVSFRRADIPMPGDKLTYGELTANIIVDEEMHSYKEMHSWLRRLVEEEVTTTKTQSPTPSIGDITLHIMSSHNNEIAKIRYINCVPTSIGNISFQSTTSGVEYLVFPVSFKFGYFEV